MWVRVSRRSEAPQDRPCALAPPPRDHRRRGPQPVPHASGPSGPRARDASPRVWTSGGPRRLRRHKRDSGSSHRVCWPAWLVRRPPLTQRAETPWSGGDEGWCP